MGISKKIALIVSAAVLAAGIGIGVAVCWRSAGKPIVFCDGTTVNGVAVGGLQDFEAVQALDGAAQDRTLRVIFADGKEKLLKGAELGLRVQDSGQITTLLEEQQAQMARGLTLEELQLEVEGLYACTEEEVLRAVTGLPELTAYADVYVEPARLVYDEAEDAYVLRGGESVSGAVDPEALAGAIIEAVAGEETELDVAEAGLYGNSSILASSETAQAALAQANAQLSLTITYAYRVASADIYGEETIDRELLRQWLAPGEDGLTLEADAGALEDYCAEMYQKYSDKTGKHSQFVTTGGELIDVDVPANDQYVDTQALYDDILDCIVTVQGGTREAPYGRTASGLPGTNNLGGTYVEVDLDNQHLYLYQDGALIAEDDICSGDVATYCTTPTGLYTIKSKETDRYLRGSDYVEWVSYWLPFYGNYGMHDATWRTYPEEFGGDVYLTNGSHGCINMPLELAEKVYQTVEVGTYVILYGGVQPPKQDQSITCKKEYTVESTDAPFKLGAKTSGNGTLSYKSSDTSVVTVNSKGVVTVKGPGKAVITITASATSRYRAASTQVTVVVNQAQIEEPEAPEEPEVPEEPEAPVEPATPEEPETPEPADEPEKPDDRPGGTDKNQNNNGNENNEGGSGETGNSGNMNETGNETNEGNEPGESSGEGSSAAPPEKKAEAAENEP